MQQTLFIHGVRQLRSAWFDGPAYITQCPIQPGQSYLYNFTITGQRGTLFWHAHISWMRSTVHGAFIIRPKPHHYYPFPTPIAEIPVVLGMKQFESHSSTSGVIDQALCVLAGSEWPLVTLANWAIVNLLANLKFVVRTFVDSDWIAS